MWISLSGRHVDDIVAEIGGLLGRQERPIHIGTDSKHRGFHTDFVTVIAVLQPGCGGLVYYERSRQPSMRSLAQKLFHEAELSLAAAARLHAVAGRRIVVHVDANADERHRSSRYVQALAGMVVGHGFEVQIKPHAWCATHVADYVVKEKHHKAA